MFAFAAVGQAQSWEKHDLTMDRNVVPNVGDAMWDLLFSFSATAVSGAAGNAGCEWDGTYFYSTRWASTLIHQYNADGTLGPLGGFSITGVSGLRDLAYCDFDGLMYGGAAGGTIWGMDFSVTPPVLVRTITGAFQSRAIAYNSDNDSFYCSNWGDPVWEVDRTTGAILGSFNLGSTTSTYGFAYENLSTGNPTLWIHDQGGSRCEIWEYDLSVPGFTGVFHDVTMEFPGAIAGGLGFATDYQAGVGTLIALAQSGTPSDSIAVYELFTTGPQLALNPDPVVGGQPVQITYSNGTPSTNAYVASSFAGPGSTFIPQLNVTLGILNPVRRAGPTMADPSGGVTWTLNVPNIMPRPVWVQAAQFGVTSPVVATSIL
jgi:hypothetical protein